MREVGRCKGAREWREKFQSKTGINVYSSIGQNIINICHASVYHTPSPFLTSPSPSLTSPSSALPHLPSPSLPHPTSPFLTSPSPSSPSSALRVCVCLYVCVHRHYILCIIIIVSMVCACVRVYMCMCVYVHVLIYVCVYVHVCVDLCTKKKKKEKKEDPRSLGLVRELTLTLRILRRLVVWETSCETQSSPHTVLCTGVLQLTTEGQDFFFRNKSEKPV